MTVDTGRNASLAVRNLGQIFTPLLPLLLGNRKWEFRKDGGAAGTSNGAHARIAACASTMEVSLGPGWVSGGSGGVRAIHGEWLLKLPPSAPRSTG